jgi:chorismate synthase
MNSWGKNINLSIFGESRGVAVGCVLDGLPAGFLIDWEAVRRDLKRRAPGNFPWASERREPDDFEILSGIYRDRTNGAPICVIFKNVDARDEDFNGLLRPGHADLAAFLKFGEFADLRGGGHFSGRLTTPLVFAGAVAKQFIAARGIRIFARIASIGEISDVDFQKEIDAENDFSRKIILQEKMMKMAADKDFSAYSRSAEEKMKEIIALAKSDGDSVGGVIEAAAFGAPAGLGSPFFDSFESRASSLIFAIPGIRGVEFGGGFALSAMRGSASNDDIFVQNGKFFSKTNQAGGILGGLTTGMPIIVRAGFKPTPSIQKEQTTINVHTMTSDKINSRGRNDPCVAARAAVIVEAALALCAFDFIFDSQGARGAKN